MSKVIKIQDYTYKLPQDRIAVQPLLKRDESKLLVYQHGHIAHSIFKNLVDFLPPDSVLFFNDTKVIPARIHFQKETGAGIEIFLLNPILPDKLLAHAMLAKKHCAWQGTIGNLKRWKDGQTLVKQTDKVLLTASLLDRSKGIVEFQWNENQSFAEVLADIGLTPLPPYINREATREDVTRYQTVYSKHDGAVAAPTAGLHFTDHVFESLQKRNVERDFLTLHVSAGTFQPVKVENALDHTMHHEQVIIPRQTIDNLLNPEKIIIAVGTTSLRTLESLYWFGVKLLENPNCDFVITQYDPYYKRQLPDPKNALRAIADYMDKNALKTLTGTTSIFIYPGYKFSICKGLITNFHQPASTLMLLVAAFTGNDWQSIYNEAISQNYRFLSYGDSSLLLP